MPALSQPHCKLAWAERLDVLDSSLDTCSASSKQIASAALIRRVAETVRSSLSFSFVKQTATRELV